MKKVIVTCPTNGDMELDAAHAERLVNMPNNGGWVYKETQEEKTNDRTDTNTGKARKAEKSK